MRVMIINSVVDYGSTGKIVRDIANELKLYGHEVLIAYGRHEIVDAKDTLYFGNCFSSGYHLMMTRLFGNHGLHSKKATKKLIEEIKRFNPDIINLHNIHGYYVNYPMLMDFLAEIEVKVYWTLHDAWPFSGSAAYFDYHGCKVWEDGCVICKSTNDYPRVKLLANQERNFYLKKEKFTQVKDLTIITPSDWLSSMAKNTFLKKYHIATINNGIDLNTFKIVDVNQTLEKLEIRDKFVILGVASKWENRKGLKYFLDLSKHIKKDEIIVLIGLDQKQIRALPKNIIGIERTKNIEELVEFYNIADVFMNPTLEDNFPTTNIEAIACGTPVITFDTGGSPEAIDKNTGIVTKNKNVKDLLKAKETIRNSQSDYLNNCRGRAEKKYSKKTFANKYYELFSEFKNNE